MFCRSLFVLLAIVVLYVLPLNHGKGRDFTQMRLNPPHLCASHKPGINKIAVMFIFLYTAHILIFQYLLFSTSFLKWFWSTVSIIYTLFVWWYSLVYLIMGQWINAFYCVGRTVVKCNGDIVFSIDSFSVWDIGSRKDSSSI